ncbi:MAG: DUF3048 domain-containing protein [Candidatus Nomurabacteria bacterium]|nr:MAG: DUF3048 domain-containing protein [Candidatus Nomurabacteria bacterium]
MKEKAHTKEHHAKPKNHPWNNPRVIGISLAVLVVLSGSLLWAAVAFTGNSDANNGIGIENAVTVNAAFTNEDANHLPETEATELPRQLDGVLVAKEKANLLPWIIMFDNHPDARPHANLSKASVAYNTLVEGGATRIMAVFSPDNVSGELGPVRSARPVYIEWLSEYNAAYMHAGGSPEALQELSGFSLRDLNCLTNAARYCYRGAGYAPHNLYTNTEKLTFAMRDLQYEDVQPDFRSWRFKDEDAIEARGNFTELSLQYSSGTYNPHYEYDRERNVYLRFNANDPHMDRAQNVQIAPKNVVVQVIPEIVAIGEKGRLTLNVTGQGKAVLFRDGLVIEGHWEKPTRTDRTVFYADDGTEMKFNRGQSWVEVIPDGRGFPYH